MARRKRQFLEDDDDTDSGDSQDADLEDLPSEDRDARDERELFEKPYSKQRNKRRRTNGKDDAIYGVFADDSEDEGFGGSGGKNRGVSAAKRSDWTKAPAFVTGDKVELDVKSGAEEAEENFEEDVEEDAEVEDAEADPDDDEEEDLDGSASSKPPSPRVREEEEEEPEEKPRFGGLGMGSAKANPIQSPFASRPSAPPLGSESSPSAFGGARTPRSFLRDGGSTSSSKPSTPLPAAEQRHFSKLQSSFGAKMLAKMGWETGTGLGPSGEGIVIPVETRMRPKNMGIAFKGFKEKTEQSKAEARRRGEVVSDDEDERPARKGKAKGGPQKGLNDRSDAWKKPKKVKTKVEHKTYEQIVAEAEDLPAPGVGKIIDATGATLREVSSLADISIASWTPSTDATRIPEVRHNLRLIVDVCKGDLDGLAREAKAMEDRKKWVRDEDARLRKTIEEEAELIARLQQVHLIVDDISTQAKELASVYEASLEPFSPYFDKLLNEYPKEFDRYRLDEIVVSAIAPIVRRMIAQWQPLENPTAMTTIFRRWRRALKMSVVEKPQNQVDTYGTRTVSTVAPKVDLPMTPYESLLWNAWLPKVRSCINNEWSAQDPHPAVRLYEAWSDLLPPFMQDNVFDQLILPKVHKAVADWSPRKDSVSLHNIVFPWLAYVGLRLEDVLGDAKRKVRSLLRSWVVSDGVPKDLIIWKDIFDAGDWEAMLLKYVVPKLGATLRDDFRVNPRNQDMTPLQQILQWADILRLSISSQLFETEFFPKWLDILHVWLIQPNPSFDEITQWYVFWKGVFPENLRGMEGFTRGLQLMNKAIELGPNAPTQLPRPDHKAAASALASLTDKTPREGTPRSRLSRVQEITFRSIVEDYASSHDLLFVPTGRAHEKSRMPLFRVSETVDGKGGVLVYILDDAVWALVNGEYRAINLENMVLHARGH